MLANVKIEQDKENKHIHRVFIDGKQIEKITHLDFHVNPLEFPTVTLNIERMSGSAPTWFYAILGISAFVKLISYGVDMYNKGKKSGD